MQKQNINKKKTNRKHITNITNTTQQANKATTIQKMKTQIKKKQNKKKI